MARINVLGTDISIYTKRDDDFISLSDIAKKKNSEEPRFVIINWLRNRNTVEFLGIWEKIHNPNFNRVGFDTVRLNTGLNSFTISPSKWIKNTNAIGIVSKSGRYESGTYAHEDIALEFASWISPEFKLYFIKEFRRLKYDENERKQLDWNLKRNLAKINYVIHTDAIEENLIPPEVTEEEAKMIYASEADVLNKALFGKTAKEWKNLNPDKKGNMRDYSNVTQLVCLSNLENLNALFIDEGLSQSDRLVKLNKIAITQMKLLTKDKTAKQLGVKKDLRVY
ncbi:MAG: KilA-N domain-containing protein [Candidatus Aenigmarchaeota archaeon]|nr:KilA-N domain-containing protein [Candidatus Aenigmarchaeota archaeon]